MRAHGAAFLARHGATLSTLQRRTLADVAACRTAALGGHVRRCRGCGVETIAYNSCRNRHCPKCQGSRTAAWLRREASLLLPVDYYHVVFTLPPSVAEVVWQNQRSGYTWLFRAASEALREVAANPKHLGAQVGLLAVLHTWGQDLHYHPHLHVVATGGGLACAQDGVVERPSRWVKCRPGFFLPVRVLSRVFRGKFLALLRQAQSAGQLGWHGEQAGLAEPAAFAAWLAEQYGRDWVVYAKPPFGGPERVLKYLVRYTHRVALSNHRLVSLEAGQVTFTAKDYASEGRRRLVRLSAAEFLRRWVQHVLPRGFVKIRHYGLLANRGQAKRLTLCRGLLGLCALMAVLLAGGGAAAEGSVGNPRCCESCGSTEWVLVGEVPRSVSGAGVGASGSLAVPDTS
ncbi:MAG TPA: IS91 family transposase [Gemmatimonadales bacterium]|nr:IS91 family transposase [Gemmatimonadales bacterium]